MKLIRPITLAAATLLVGCSAHVKPAIKPTTAALPVSVFVDANAPQVALTLDPVSQVIAGAEREFAAGQDELHVGHLVAARQRFDRAVDVFLQAPMGARGNARLETEFEHLVDRINALEMIALREGDGFSETKSEPAVIDELLSAATFDHPDATMATEKIVEADLAKTAHDLPITINDRVLSYVELFQGNLRSFMQDGLQRGARYLPMVQDVFRQAGLPSDLAYLPLIESAFKPTALSRASAKGMWQFELDTAQDYGLQQNWFLDERSDPEKATRAAAQHLKMLGSMFDGDWNMALAGYNAGQGRVQRAVKISKIADYWKLTSTSRYLPRETREYVPMVLAAIIIAKNPAQYGFDVAAADAPQCEFVTIPNALDLRFIAEWTGTSIEVIRDLNPELRRMLTPLGQHELRVPLGTAAAVEAKLASADASIFAPIQRYVVKRGETLATIARRYHTSSAKLAEANYVKPGSRVRAGQELMVPRATNDALTTRATKPATGVLTSSAPSTYRVKPGDTLSAIARQFAISVDDLKRLNHISSDVIVVGDKLTVKR